MTETGVLEGACGTGEALIEGGPHPRTIFQGSLAHCEVSEGIFSMTTCVNPHAPA